MNDELYDQLVQARTEGDNSKREAFEESIRRMKAEKDAIEAIRRVNFQSMTLNKAPVSYLTFFNLFTFQSC